MSFNSNIIGPFLINNTIICFNSSLLPDWNPSNFTHNYYYENELQEAALSCPQNVDSVIMVGTMVHFWNLAFTLMIITAVLGNTAVLWIVIRNEIL